MATDDHREWFANTILRGIKGNQFRTSLSTLAAITALACIDQTKASTVNIGDLDLESLATPELVLAAEIDLGFGRHASVDREKVQLALLRRVFSERIAINDAAEAATLAIVVQHIIDGIALGSADTTPIEKVLLAYAAGFHFLWSACRTGSVKEQFVSRK